MPRRRQTVDRRIVGRLAAKLNVVAYAKRKLSLKEETREMCLKARRKGWIHVLRLIAYLTYRRIREMFGEFVVALQSEHTIVSAVAPNPEDTAGDRLHDENVVHIFWTLMLAELCVLCLLRGGKSQPLFSLTTLINGLITTFTCTFVASCLKRVFRWGNKERWKRREIRRAPAIVRLVRKIAQLFVPKQKAHEAPNRQRLVYDRKRGWFNPDLIVDRPRTCTPPKPSIAKRMSQAIGMALKSLDKLMMKILVAKEQGNRSSAKFVKMAPRLHLFRFCLAWLINAAVFAIACIINLVYGVMFSAPAFTELLMAWVAGLIFSWAVIEPSEVGIMILLPCIANNPRIMYCREKCKELGFVAWIDLATLGYQPSLLSCFPCIVLANALTSNERVSPPQHLRLKTLASAVGMDRDNGCQDCW